MGVTEVDRNLQKHDWPVVTHCQSLPASLRTFVGLSPDRRTIHLSELRSNVELELYSRVLHEGLSVVSAYIFGYRDSPVYLRTDPALETELLQIKITLESEVLDHWLRVENRQKVSNQADLYSAMQQLLEASSALDHPLFDFIETEIGREALEVFLLNECIRTEIVDDEVALMIPGLQGTMKAAIASNLWDECGNGRLDKFHTYWLRRLLNSRDWWARLARYREEDRPWFASITTNVFNIFLTRPGLRLTAYGWFLINESWVAPHFKKILSGMVRHGLTDRDTQAYFKAHVYIDPSHTRELLTAMRDMVPALSPVQCQQVLDGAVLAIEATKRQYDYMLGYLRSFDPGQKTVKSLRV